MMEWVAGIDEAGRGCLCGSLFVAGVIGQRHILTTFNAKDSKKLSPKKREYIYQMLINAAHKNQIGLYVTSISAEEIDKNGLSAAMKKGIESVLNELCSYAVKHKIPNGLDICLDGNTTFNAQLPDIAKQSHIKLTTMIKGDNVLNAISCASIAAKVCKDRQMHDLDRIYPQYALAKNKGYGTLEHRKSIMQHGYSPYHRKSFKCVL